jgi:hypothetical protein
LGNREHARPRGSAIRLVSRSDSGRPHRFAAPAEWRPCVRQLLIF